MLRGRAEQLEGELAHLELEQATLRPNRHVGHGAEIFTRAQVTGAFEAQRNTKKVTQLLNELNRVFGLRPDYQVPAEGPDLL